MLLPEAVMGGWSSCPIWAVLLFLPFACAQVSSYPVDISDVGLPRGELVKYYLETTQFSLRRVALLPLTRQVAQPWSDAPGLNITGKLIKVGPENANKLSMGDIAYVSCDESAYSGNLGVQGTIHEIISNQVTAGAMVLYSIEYDYCKYAAPMSRNKYTGVFSVMNSTTARDILEGLDSAGSTDSGTSSIASDASTNSGRAAETLPGTNINDGAYGGGGGDTPSSSVAMIILYSVTGIITFLFLAVIIVGTVRAHRHPERYGPQNVAGRPRQSRARGIARAMLETLPIVKFGDSDDTRNEPKQDIEMASHDGEHEDQTGTGVRQNDAAKEPGQDQTGGVITRTQSAASPPQDVTDEHAERRDAPRRSVDVGETGQIGPALLSRPGTPSHDESVAQGTLGCPICTDDFVKGQDVRLLPCDHKFHPECIDPWLINVSGTCPLCRIDLAPPSAAEGSRRGSAAPGSEQQHAPPEETANPEAGVQNRRTSRHHRRLSEYLHDTFHSVPRRELTLEQRLDAVRRARSAHSLQIERPAEDDRTAAVPVEAVEDTGRRATLTTRLRDRFRVRTRRHGEEMREESTGDATRTCTTGGA